MSKLAFSLDKLADLDMGKVNEQFKKAVAFVVRDCQERALDQSKRTITLTMNMTPAGQELDSDAVMVEFEIAAKVPVRRSRPYSMESRPNGSLVFNPESPDDVKQGTLDDQN